MLLSKILILNFFLLILVAKDHLRDQEGHCVFVKYVVRMWKVLHISSVEALHSVTIGLVGCLL